VEVLLLPKLDKVDTILLLCEYSYVTYVFYHFVHYLWQRMTFITKFLLAFKKKVNFVQINIGNSINCLDQCVIQIDNA